MQLPVKNLNSRLGYTLIEILTILGITAVVGTAALVNLPTMFRSESILDAAASELRAQLTFAQQNSASQNLGDNWGVYLDATAAGSHNYKVFRGNSYAVGTVIQTVSLPSEVIFLSPAQGNIDEVIFEKASGDSLDPHSIILALAADNLQARYIAISAGTGLITLSNTEPALDLSISLSAGSGTVQAGSSLDVNISVSLLSGTPAPADFSASNLPANVTASFAPTSCTPNCSTVMTLTASPSAPAGTTAISVNAVSGSIIKSANFSLTIVDLIEFSLAADPVSGNVDSGLIGQVTSSITAIKSSGNPADIIFSASGSPTGATAGFSPANCIPDDSCSVQMTVDTSPSTPTGTSTISVTGTAGSVVRTTSYDLVVKPFNFSISLSPGSGSVSEGIAGDAIFSANISRISGAPQSVSFSASGLPSGATAFFSGANCTPSDTCSSDVTISANSSVVAGNYAVAITATGGSVSKTANFSFTVTPYDSVSVKSSVMPSGRYLMGGVVGPNTSFMYFFGGQDASNWLTQVARYDYSSVVTAYGNAFTRRSGMACAPSVLTARNYCFGGYANGSYYGEIYEYYGGQNWWDQSINVRGGIGARADASCVESSVTKKIYCFGGADNYEGWWGAKNEILEYDSLVSTVTTKSATLPGGRRGLSCVESEYNGKIYCFGGVSGSSYYNQIVEYDPVNNAIVTKAGVLPSTRAYLSCAENSYTQKIYCFGGANWSSSLLYNQILEYNPASDVLVTRPTVTPQSIAGQSCLENPVDHKIYCFAGKNGFNWNSYTNQIFEYLRNSLAGFNISQSSHYGSIYPGQSALSSFTASMFSGSAQNVYFEVSGSLPSGVTAAMNPFVCSAPCTSTLSIDTTEAVAPGIYHIGVNATSDGITRKSYYRLTINSFTAPSAPQNQSGNYTVGQITLSWSAPLSDGGKAISNYKIYRGTTPGGETLLATTGNVLTYSDNSIDNGTTYYYKVSAVNTVAESPLSGEIIVNKLRTFVTSGRWTGAMGGLSGADNLCQSAANSASLGGAWKAWLSTASVSASSRLVNTSKAYTLVDGTTLISRNWSDLTDGYLDYSAIIKFENGQTLSTSLTFEKIVFTNTTESGGNFGGDCNGWTSSSFYSYPWLGYADNTYYRYYEWTRGSYGNWSCGTIARLYCFEQGSLIAPSISATPGVGQITLNWSAVSGATGYKVYRGTASGNETLFATLGSVTSYANAGLSNGSTYFYKLKAITAVEESDYGNEVSATTYSLSGAPQNLTAQAGTYQITLNWDAPVSNGGSSITNYKIYRGTSPGGETLLATIGNVLTYTNTGLSNSVTYYYKVSAVNAVGESSQSNESTGISPYPVVSSAPQNLSGGPDIYSVALSWSAPSFDGYAAITQYKIYRSATAGNPAPTLIAALSAPIYWYNDTSAPLGVTNYYKIKAVNSVGDSPFSNEFSNRYIWQNVSGAGNYGESCMSWLTRTGQRELVPDSICAGYSNQACPYGLDNPNKCVYVRSDGHAWPADWASSYTDGYGSPYYPSWSGTPYNNPGVFATMYTRILK